MKITVKKLKTIDIEKLLNKHEIEVVVQEQQPHCQIMHRMTLKNVSWRNPKMANSKSWSMGCDPENRDAILIDLANALNWKVITLPSGDEVGPYVVTCKWEDQR
jgi:hypothetical protein